MCASGSVTGEFQLAFSSFKIGKSIFTVFYKASECMIFYVLEIKPIILLYFSDRTVVAART